MSKYLLLYFSIFVSNSSIAQNISIKKDTIYVSGKALATLKTMQKQPVKYSINNLDDKTLIIIHNSRVDIKGSPGYVFTFPNDGKQAMVAQHSKGPKSFIEEIVKIRLIENGTVNEQAEKSFIATHPVPKGYTDIDKLIEY